MRAPSPDRTSGSQPASHAGPDRVSLRRPPRSAGNEPCAVVSDRDLQPSQRKLASRPDARRSGWNVVWTNLRHFSIWGVIGEARPSWSARSLGMRAARPSCLSGRALPSWVADVDEPLGADARLFSCAQPDPGNGNVLELRMVNNRSYALWLAFEGTTPKWVWHETLKIGNPDLVKLLDEWRRPPVESQRGASSPWCQGSHWFRRRQFRHLHHPCTAGSRPGASRGRIHRARRQSRRRQRTGIAGTVPGMRETNNGSGAIAVAKWLVREAINCGLASVDLIVSGKVPKFGKPPVWLKARVVLLSNVQRVLAAIGVHYATFGHPGAHLNRTTVISVRHDPKTQPSPPPTPPPPPPPPPGPPPPPPPAAQRVAPYNNYGAANAGRAMCRGNPGNASSMPGGTVSQTFTVPAGVAAIDQVLVQIDPDSRVTGHGALAVNGAVPATANAAAAGDTTFNFPRISVGAGDQVRFSVSFSATFGSIITVYTAGNPGGQFTTSNSCPAGAPSVSVTTTGLRAVVYGWNR